MNLSYKSGCMRQEENPNHLAQLNLSFPRSPLRTSFNSLWRFIVWSTWLQKRSDIVVSGRVLFPNSKAFFLRLFPLALVSCVWCNTLTGAKMSVSSSGVRELGPALPDYDATRSACEDNLANSISESSSSSEDVSSCSFLLLGRDSLSAVGSSGVWLALITGWSSLGTRSNFNCKKHIVFD